jgi:hypothetical protein
VASLLQICLYGGFDFAGRYILSAEEQ